MDDDLYRLRGRATIYLWGASFLLSLVGVGFLIADCLFWLESGTWRAKETDLLFKWLPELKAWVATPDSWLGLHTVVAFILKLPWTLFLPVLTFFAAIVTMPEVRLTGDRPATSKNGPFGNGSGHIGREDGAGK